jgi:type VI secretion system secreted protein VgrG
MSTENFITTVVTPLGTDQLLFSHLIGHDAIGRLFEFELELLRPEELGSVNSSELMGHDMTVTIASTTGLTRYINGAVVEFKHTGMVNRFYRYRAILRPWLWFLTLNANCRIFQEKTVPDIIKAVFADYTFADVEYHLEETYTALSYCVQYRESDFNFVSRLMEHEGIFYYFKHLSGKHTLVITDSGSNYQQIDGYQTIPYFPTGNIANRERDHIYEWLSSQQVSAGKYEHNDFNFETPSANLTAKSQKLGAHSINDMEVYDFPGKYSVADTGTQLSDKRIEELHRQASLIQGEGNALALQAGMEFTLKGFYFAAENVKHFVVSASYEMGCAGGYASGNDSGGPLFNCRFVAMNSQQSFRSARTTEKPVISGAQTAIVVGKAGEEIWTDQYGRVKVKFHWDREPAKDETSSCWIRVAYPAAGKKWGWVSLPRIGQEVIVSFLHGDPDQPLITGTVYNAEQMPPYDLPTNQTQSGMKSRSSKTGIADNFNELRFEDKKGSEEVYVHAEKDFNCVIENNETRKIGLDKKDEGNQTTEIQNDRTTTLNTGNDTLTVKQGDSITKISLGDYKLDIDAGKATITAMTSIELKVGSNSIKLDQQGITVNGIMVKIDATAKLDANSPLTTVGASGVLTLQGTLTKIN